MQLATELDPYVQRQVADELGLYVYMLVDPRDSVPFYVGKGRRERFANHGLEAMIGDVDPVVEAGGGQHDVSAKVAQIKAIRNAGLKPQVWIIRYGMKSGPEYTAVEAACIDLLSSFPIQPQDQGVTRIPNWASEQLTNRRREQSRGHGIMLLEDLIAEIGAPLLETELPMITVDLGGWVDTPGGERMPGGWTRSGYGYKAEWLPSEQRVKHFQEIGESACGWFRLSPSTVKNRGVKHAVAVHRGVTRALLRIEDGSIERQRYGPRNYRVTFEFEVVDKGEEFNQVVGPYGHRLPRKRRGAQNTRYWPRPV